MLGQVVSVDMLHDDVLLEIFDFYVGVDLLSQKGIPVDMWRTLVRVCRRWRSLVFGSPRRLKLRLVCLSRTRTRKRLDAWPTLPLIIQGHTSSFVMDNLIAALERKDRVCKIDLTYYDSLEPGKFWAAMREPFPNLTHLCLEARTEPTSRNGNLTPDWGPPEPPRVQDVSDSFLGGSAPRLQSFRINAVRLQGLQKLLLSATHLIDLHLFDIPDYISSQRMVTCLSVLTGLQTLSLAFQRDIYPSYQESRHPPSPTRVVLPALRYFQFTGAGKYLENLVALIDAPELDKLTISLNYRGYNNPELAQFICRIPKLGVPCEARVVFHEARIAIRVRFPSQIFGHKLLDVGIPFKDLCYGPTSEEVDFQVHRLAQVCDSLLTTVSTVENLYIYEASDSIFCWSGDWDLPWLDLLRPFIALKNLYIFKEFAQRVASALEYLDEGSISELDSNSEMGSSSEAGSNPEAGGNSEAGIISEESSNSELLPSLQNIFVRGLQPSGHIGEGLEQFIAARRRTGHPIAVSTWDTEFDETWQ